jgi:Concanavalin A-like lectin/glucanases superfamily
MNAARLQDQTTTHRTHSRRTRVLVALAWLVFGLLGAAPLVSEAAVLATYRFNNTLAADEPGRPALVAVDPLGLSSFDTIGVLGQTRRIYRFNGNRLPATQQAGLVLATTGLTSPTSYSVEMAFGFNDSSRYLRVLDVQNRTSDNGFYVNPDNHLELFANDETLAVGTTPFTTGFYHVVLVVDAGTVKAYLNGTLEFTVATTAMNLDNLNNPQRLINFFLDNTSGGVDDEYSDGSVALIRLHNGALTDGEVAQLFADNDVTDVPRITVLVSDTTLLPGESVVVSVTLDRPAPVLVDAYVVIVAPGGIVLSVVPGGVVLGLVPLASSFEPPLIINAQVFQHTFTGPEPAGDYLVLGALTQAGTLNVLGLISERVFTFAK